jgi:hypothetical protein
MYKLFENSSLAYCQQNCKNGNAVSHCGHPFPVFLCEGYEILALILFLIFGMSGVIMFKLVLVGFKMSNESENATPEK